MLVLNRKKGETIIIRDNIRITVIDVQGDNIKLGIEAPREVSIYRQELYEEITAANQQANQNEINAEQLKRLKDFRINRS
jgi:carbon storage regulator